MTPSDGSVLAGKLDHCHRIARAWDAVNQLCIQIKGARVEVTEPLHMARVKLGEAQEAAEQELGHRYRVEQVLAKGDNDGSC